MCSVSKKQGLAHYFHRVWSTIEHIDTKMVKDYIETKKIVTKGKPLEDSVAVPEITYFFNCF